jgi:hypothetical protein
MMMLKTNKYFFSPILLLVIISISLSSCATKVTKKPIVKEVIVVKSETPSEPSTSNQTSTESYTNGDENIVEYINKVLNMTGDAQKKELQDLIQTQQGNKQEIYTRTKLALLYGLPTSRVRDYAKAQTLADDLLKERSLDPERRTILIIMRDYLTETIKISIKLREEQKKGDVMQGKLDALQIKADAAQQRADSLQQKLDELKDIEKTMINRNHGNKK